MADENSLKEDLSRLLGWDPMIIDSVVQNISQAASLADVMDIVEVRGCLHGRLGGVRHLAAALHSLHPAVCCHQGLQRL